MQKKENVFVRQFSVILSIFAPQEISIIKYELIIFDCDGTLVDSESLTNQVIADLLTENGIPTTASDSYELFAGKKFWDIEQYILKQTGSLPKDSFEIEFRKRCTPLFQSELKPIEGVIEMLDLLPASMCIASNGPRKKMDITLTATGLDKYFPVKTIFSAYDIQKWKPDPALFLHAADQMDSMPKKSVVIEDSVSGIMGAINANIDVIAYNPHERSDILDTRVPSFTKMNEITDFLLSY